MAGYSVTYTVVDNATKQIDAINRRITQMRAPLDRLSRQVSRFVDVSGLKKVAEGFGWIARAAGSVLRTLTAIVPVMGAITGAASIAGMVKLVSTYAAWSRELVAAADNIGTTTQTLQQFQDATRLAGGDSGQMTESLKGLHDTLGNINIGTGNAAQALQWFNHLGINIRDANGRMRQTTELMPELIQRLADIRNPIDRARAANELLGASGDRLVETFRQSSQTFAQWFTDVGRYKDLTDEQKRSLQQFSEAQGRVGVAFDRLGQQISIVLARDFGPLLTRISEFVEKHTPDIIAAVDRISQRFIAWLQGVNWSKMEDGVNSLIADLKIVLDHLDDVKLAAEVIAGIFVVKWAGGIVAAIAQVTTAIGSTGAAAGAVGGVGLLGALGAIAAIAAAIYGFKKGYDYLTAPAAPGEQPHFNTRTAEGRAARSDWLAAHPGGLPPPPAPMPYFNTRTAEGRAAKSDWLAAHPDQGGAIQQAAPPSAMNLPTDTTKRGGAINARLASDLGLTTAQSAGIVGNLQAESGLKAQQERNPLGGGRGGFGWAQWTGPRRLDFEKYAKDNNLDPKSDEANYGFLLKELHGAGNAKMLEQLRQLKGPDAAKQAAALVERMYERPAVSNAGVRGGYAEQIAAATPAAPAVAAAPPVAVPPQAPANGSVDVAITHKNPPPDSAVTASGTGNVNVAPVRVEHQDMASI